MTTPAHAAVASLLAQAAECLDAAVATAYLLADDDRQKAEERAGDDEAVLDDPEYVAVLHRCGRLQGLADAARKSTEGMGVTTPKGDPIPIPCEGSGCPGNLPGDDTALCAMCGRPVPLDGGVVAAHQRDDIIARIHRMLTQGDHR